MEMPLFKVRLDFQFAGNGSDGVPDGLLDEGGHLISPLAWWPDIPLEIEAPNDIAAVDQAQRRQTQPLTICIDARIGPERFKELEMRPQTGSGGKHSSVSRVWITQQEGEPTWHAHYVPLGPPATG
jgi:hypothetical protein